MTDFLTRLAGRALGLVSVAQPVIPSRYAPGPTLASSEADFDLWHLDEETLPVTGLEPRTVPSPDTRRDASPLRRAESFAKREEIPVHQHEIARQSDETAVQHEIARMETDVLFAPAHSAEPSMSSGEIPMHPVERLQNEERAASMPAQDVHRRLIPSQRAESFMPQHETALERDRAVGQPQTSVVRNVDDEVSYPGRSVVQSEDETPHPGSGVVQNEDEVPHPISGVARSMRETPHLERSVARQDTIAPHLAETPVQRRVMDTPQVYEIPVPHNAAMMQPGETALHNEREMRFIPTQDSRRHEIVERRDEISLHHNEMPPFSHESPVATNEMPVSSAEIVTGRDEIVTQHRTIVPPKVGGASQPGLIVTRRDEIAERNEEGTTSISAQDTHRDIVPTQRAESFVHPHETTLERDGVVVQRRVGAGGNEGETSYHERGATLKEGETSYREGGATLKEGETSYREGGASQEDVIPIHLEEIPVQHHVLDTPQADRISVHRDVTIVSHEAEMTQNAREIKAISALSTRRAANSAQLSAQLAENVAQPAEMLVQNEVRTGTISTDNVIETTNDNSGTAPSAQRGTSTAPVNAPPAIRITIGRIDVRAIIPPSPAPAPKASKSAARPSLENYLKQNGGGER